MHRLTARTEASLALLQSLRETPLWTTVRLVGSHLGPLAEAVEGVRFLAWAKV